MVESQASSLWPDCTFSTLHWAGISRQILLMLEFWLWRWPNKEYVWPSHVDSFFLRLNAAEDKENNLLLFPNKKAVKLVLGSNSIVKKLGAYKFGNYAGSIQYNLSSAISEDLHVKDQLNIILKKSEKRFGNESVLIWEVFFSAQLSV